MWLKADGYYLWKNINFVFTSNEKAPLTPLSFKFQLGYVLLTEGRLPWIADQWYLSLCFTSRTSNLGTSAAQNCDRSYSSIFLIIHNLKYLSNPDVKATGSSLTYLKSWGARALSVAWHETPVWDWGMLRSLLWVWYFQHCIIFRYFPFLLTRFQSSVLYTSV